jgi:ADP-ribose pyrophosphatase
MKIKILDDEIVYDGDFIQMIRRRFVDTEGNERVWEMMKRKIYGRIVAIAALTPEKELILEKIYRIPCKGYVLELPAGLTDKKDESEVQAIRRELLEETGYTVDTVKSLFSGYISAGAAEDEYAVYVGTNARFVQEPHLEGTEDIEVVKVPLHKLTEYVMNNKGGLKADIKIAAILPYLKQHGYA